MRSVPVYLEHDPSRPAGVFTFDAGKLPPGADWILSPGYRMVQDPETGGKRVSVRSMGLIDVRQHDRFPQDPPSLLRRFHDLARRLFSRHFRSPR